MNDYLGNLLGPWACELCAGSVLFRLALAAVLASIVGCERSSKRHSAGLRTFIVLTLAAAAIMCVDMFLMESMHTALPLLSCATVIGLAILSSNTILFNSKNQIKGLTTSAGLWGCGIMGLSVGAGLYSVSLILFVLLLCGLSLLPSLEKYLKDRSNHFEVQVELKNRNSLSDFVATVRALGISIDEIEANPAYHNSGLSVFTVMFTVNSRELKKYKHHSDIITALQSLEYVSYIEEIQ